MWFDKVLKGFQAGGKWFFEALFPEKCLVCRKEGAYLCESHYQFVPPPKNEVSFEYLDDLFVSTAYAHEPVSLVVEYFKFKGFRGVGNIMAFEMQKALSVFPLKDCVLVPVPLHWTRWVWRGFNQSAVLGRQLKKLIPDLVLSYGLRRRKMTSQQARLGKRERAINMQEAFVWDKKMTVPDKVLLIDDVVTSGATLDMAAKTLKRCGVRVVCALVFARSGEGAGSRE